MVQMVIGSPPERFPSPESRPDSPRLAQRLSQVFGLFGPMTGPGRAIFVGQKSNLFELFGQYQKGSGLVQLVTKLPQKRFRTSIYRYRSQWATKESHLSPFGPLDRHVVKQVIVVKIRRNIIMPMNQYEMTLSRWFVF